MNDPHFACTACRVYIDAGYRWAFSELERPAHVSRGSVVDIDRVFQAESYWNPPDEDGSHWLRQLLPEVKAFLKSHRSHAVLYAESESFLDVESPDQFDWLHIAGFVHQPTPRYFAEVLKLQSWQHVETWVAANREPWWWQFFPEQYAWARRKFEALVRNKGASGKK